MTKNELLQNALLELREASLSIHSKSSDWHETMDKYNMLFLGEKFNKISSIELTRTLNNYFSMDITGEELIQILPETCKLLNIYFEALVSAENHTKLTGYYIMLH
ncbi:hypothetical protein [Lysinibacillus sp. RC79]|uniref:hypothetical protein n=1 Tax=Lysinibacillus sp. RC79 TaxID=3156296 RepID=UPI003518AC48